jgi:hypothetical protein
MHLELTAVFRPDPEGGYAAYVEEIPGANTQGRRWRKPVAGEGSRSRTPCGGARCRLLREGGRHSVYFNVATRRSQRSRAIAR